MPQGKAGRAEGRVQTTPTAYPIHKGRAPEPQRQEASVVTQTANVQVDTPERNPGEPLQAAPLPNAPIPVTMQSQPPAAPEATAQLAETLKSNDELKKALREQKDSFRQQMEEMQFRFETMATMTGPQPPQAAPVAQPPQGIDPEQNVTIGQMYNIVQQMVPQLQADAKTQAIRAAWALSPEDEQAILDRYPHLKAYPEPSRTEYVLRAYQLQQRYGAAAGSNPESVAQETTPTRPLAQPVVPLVEGNAPQTVSEPSQTNPLQQAQIEYAQAERMPRATQQEAKARMAALRNARDKIMAIQGISEDQQRQSGFTQSG